VKRKKLLDSFAMLSYLNREAGFQKVRDIMADSQKSEDPVFMNEVNIGEVYYILFRKRGREKAEYFLERVLPSLPLNPIPNGFDDVVEAARIKAEYPLSFADCFAVATAKKKNLDILTGDPEFRRVEKLAAIEWL